MQGLGCRVQSAGFRVQGLGCRVQGFQVLAANRLCSLHKHVWKTIWKPFPRNFAKLDLQRRLLQRGALLFHVEDGYRGLGFRDLGFRDSGFGISGFGIRVYRLRVIVSCFQSKKIRVWSSGLRALGFGARFTVQRHGGWAFL